jgi:putative ABC transport system permease protein
MLRRKLWADTRALARQAISLLILVGLGVTLFIGLFQAYQNISGTYNHIYQRTRMADVSVLFERAPESLVDAARVIPHVREAMGRIVGDGSIIQRGRDRERVLGRFVGVPRASRPVMNDIWILEGRYIADAHEAVLEQQFARQNNYAIGDRIKCRYATSEREFTVVGFATSPEYIYPVPSQHTMFVARGTFGVLFLDEDRARQWLGLGRQITEIHCTVAPGYEEQVLEKLEGLADSYGVEFAYTQQFQPSVRLLYLDQMALAQLSIFFPILFLSSAGLSLYGALARIVRLQVSVIGMLKASGFSDRHILTQHVMQGVLIGLGGAIPGAALGHLMSVGVSKMYGSSLMLPLVMSFVRWDTVLVGLAIATGTGLVAAYLPARMAARLHPAVAMRGDLESQGEAHRRQSRRQRLVELTRFVRVAYRIPLRGIVRRASRTFLAVAGIAGGASIMITTLGMYVATMDAIDEYVTGSRKYEIDVQLTHPAGAELAQAMAAIPGGRAASLNVTVPVRVRTSWGEGELMMTGVQRGQRLLRVRTVGDEPMVVEAGKLWLPKRFADRLRAEPGSPVHVEWVKSSRRRRLEQTMEVAGILDTAMGNSAYGEYRDIRRFVGDRVFPQSSYGAYVDVAPARAEAFKHRLEQSDFAALVSTQEDVRREIDEQMATLWVFIGILMIFGSVLAGSAIHSTASVSLLERTRELATLCSIGFSARFASWLAGLELCFLAIVGLVVGIPLGSVLNTLFLKSFETENMAFRAILPLWVHATTVAVVFVLLVFSAYVGMRRLRAMDLSQATKAHE